MPDKAVILINVGTPDSTSVKDVRKYLFQFLNDRRVIDLPLILQKILVNLIIVPFRAPKSAKLYQLMWNENGSPIIYYTKHLAEKIQNLYGNDIKVFYAMRYGKPSLKELLNKLGNESFSEIIFVPLYPQYASSTTGSVNQLIQEQTSKWKNNTKIRIIEQFYNHTEFIKAFAQRISEYNINNFEHLIFSFHGLPLRHIRKSHPEINIESCTCKTAIPEHGSHCYKATCYQTAKLLAEELNLPAEKYTVTFQSRLTKDWLSPFTDSVLADKAKAGYKNILIASPAFVTDCLETLVELEIEYSKLFIENGGKNLSLVKSLNDADYWVNALHKILQ